MNDKTREAFESWISGPPYEKEVGRYPEDAGYAWPGNYRSYEVELAWEAWQAALAEQPEQSAEPVACVPDDLKTAIKWAVKVCHEEGWDRCESELRHLAVLKSVYLAAPEDPKP